MTEHVVLDGLTDDEWVDRVMRNAERCFHGRYRIDPCLDCGRKYVEGQLVGEFHEPR